MPKHDERRVLAYSPRQLYELVAEGQGVIPREMGAYGLPHCLRISVGLEAENRAAVAALSGFLGGRRAA